MMTDAPSENHAQQAHQRQLLISRRYDMCSTCQCHPDNNTYFVYALWIQDYVSVFCCDHCVAEGALVDFVQWASTFAALGELSSYNPPSRLDDPLDDIIELSWPVGLNPEAQFEFIDLTKQPPAPIDMRQYLAPPYLDPAHPPTYTLAIDGTKLVMPAWLWHDDSPKRP